jgi:subtilisin family serine protease
VKKLFYLLFILAISSFYSSSAQVTKVEQLEKANLNWYNLDPKQDGILGTSVDKAYKELLVNRPAKKTIIVAVIDSGVDIDHEDLKGKIWVNEKEIPGNNIDDDNNGYVDDIHGWNFIGNKNGKNIHYENLEYTRIYKGDKQNPLYAKAKVAYEGELAKRLKEKENIDKFVEIYNSAKTIIKKHTGINVKTIKDLDSILLDDPAPVLRAKEFLRQRFEMGFTEEGLMAFKEHNKESIDKYLNLEFNPRSLVGDNPQDINDKNYGNPDVKGLRSNHGTSVAGIIAGIRNNGLGIDGIATDVKIMCIRSTPQGDERDKDVALAIRYAVENGADIINMSFGKSFSPEKQFVDEAVKLAEKKNVLLIHAAGNEGKDIDENENYPSAKYLDKTIAKNWLSIGASGLKEDEKAAAVFSNYGEKNVDFFAPGVDLISTDSSSTYSMNSGTSLSAPVVSGIAAVVLAHYPDLTPQQVIQLLSESTYSLDKVKVLLPNTESPEKKKVKFSNLAKYGGVVNLYEAMKRAETFTLNAKK